MGRISALIVVTLVGCGPATVTKAIATPPEPESVVPACMAGARAVALSGTTSCALCGDGRSVCWSSDFRGAGEVSFGAGRDVAGGDGYGCVLREDGALDCTSVFYGGYVLREAHPEGVARLVHGTTDPCAVLRDGTIRCWKGPRDDVELPVDELGATEVLDAFGDEEFGCVLADDLLACWDGRGTARVDLEGIVAIDGYREHWQSGCYSENSANTCVVTAEGRVACAERPTEPFVEIAGVTGAMDIVVRPDFACALLDQGRIACWDRRDVGRVVTLQAPAVDVIGLTANRNEMCAISRSGGAACWQPARDWKLQPVTPLARARTARD